MRYFVTGGTGLIGKELVRCLLRQGGEVVLLVRPRSLLRYEALFQRWEGLARESGASLQLVPGDIVEPDLGIEDVDKALGDGFAHVFHVAALYDIAASETLLRRVNVEGTRHVLDLLVRRGFTGVFHMLSSIAVAGDHTGVFREEDFEVGQKHPNAYLRTKYEAEALVREQEDLRVRIYRPGAVVGHSRTGEMDRVDGPYYLFKPLDKLRRLLPSWFPLVWRKTEPLNMVPVDYVAAAIDHIAHKEGLDGRTFHLVDPAPPPFEETFNLLSEAGAGPKIFKSVKPRLLSLFGGGELLEQLGSVRFLRAQFLRDWGIPPEVAEAMNRKVEFATKGTEAALEGSGVVCPRQEEYLEVLWDYYVRHLDPERKGTRPKRMQSTLEGKRILITGASSGVGAALARKCGQAGAHVLLVARREEELNNVAAEVREAGGQANTYVVDLSDWEACDRLIQEVDAAHDGIDILVNNAAHSIRRAIKDSVERFRDYERLIRLNYLAPVRLTLGFLPKMQAQGSGHLVNVLSAGTLFVTPRFSAYVASKAALHAFTDSFAAEFLADNLFATSVYLPLVRTPMITATDTYKDTAHVMTPEQAADWIIDGILQRKRRVLNGHSTRRFVLNILTPMAMTRILNVLFRIYAEEEDAYPELDIDRTIAKRFIKGKPF